MVALVGGFDFPIVRVQKMDTKCSHHGRGQLSGQFSPNFLGCFTISVLVVAVLKAVSLDVNIEQLRDL